MNTPEVREKLLQIIDKAIADGHWDSSLFFKNICKRLQELRNYVDHELPVEINQPAVSKSSLVTSQTPKPGHRLVYISLYQTEGQSLDRWLATLKLLAEYSVSRPVYATEAEVQEMIRSKPVATKKSEAYAIAWVKEVDILPSHAGARLQDRMGHPLLTLREDSVLLENLVVFVHDNKRYQVLGGSLVLEPV